MRIALLSGGTGGAKLSAGLVAFLGQGGLSVVTNTGDDFRAYGMLICPDTDSVFYTLGGHLDRERGWGVANDSFRCLDQLALYGEPTWFHLGDRDLALHILRADLLTSGRGLTEATAEICRRSHLDTAILPMSDQPCPTRIRTEAGWLGLQEWLVRDRCRPEVLQVALNPRAQPTAQVLSALTEADLVLIGPSNPVISIEPILALEGVRQLLVKRRDSVVAVSPLVGGRALKGPTADMLTWLGRGDGVVAVAEGYRDVAATIVIDHSDRDLADRISELGMQVSITDLVMHDAASAKELAEDIVQGIALGLDRTGGTR